MIREALEWVRGDHLPHYADEDRFEDGEAALVALDSLLAALARVEQERDELRETAETRARLGYPASWARLDAAEAGRDAADAQAARYRETLMRIANHAPIADWRADAARAVLAAVDEPPPSEAKT